MRWCWIIIGVVACGSGNQTPERPAPVAPEEPAQACTQIGCGPAFEVRFKKQTGWAKGKYRLPVAFDSAAPTTCTITLPLKCDVEQRCEGPNAGDFHIGESGCALPSEAHELLGVTVNQGVTPAAIRVSVYHQGKQLASQDHTPQYKQSFPNGPDCGPGCTSAPGIDLHLP